MICEWKYHLSISISIQWITKVETSTTQQLLSSFSTLHSKDVNEQKKFGNSPKKALSKA